MCGWVVPTSAGPGNSVEGSCGVSVFRKTSGNSSVYVKRANVVTVGGIYLNKPASVVVTPVFISAIDIFLQRHTIMYFNYSEVLNILRFFTKSLFPSKNKIMIICVLQI